jgi:hypothetical protein
VRLGDVEQVGAVGDGEGVGLRVFVDESYFASGGAVVSRAVRGGGDWVGTDSSPGFGSSRWPWWGVGVLENWRAWRSCSVGLGDFEDIRLL